MKKFSITLAIALLLPIVLSAGKVYEAEKVEHYSFPASSNHTLTVDNKYGNIKIEVWDRNEVNATVTITGKSSRSQGQANELAGRVKINASTMGSNIIFRTEWNPLNISGSGTHSSDTYYHIKVPRSIAFNLTNKYGNISIDECGNKAMIDVKYGNFYCTKMTGSSSNLTLGYGNATIQEVNQLTADIKYSNITLNKANTLNLKTQYSQLTLGIINKASINTSYGSYKITDINHAEINAKYTPIIIGKVNQLLNITNKYGNIKIEDVDKNIDTLNFSLGYTDLKLNIPSAISYEFDLSNRYGSITLPMNIPTAIKHKETGGNSTALRGTAGSGKPTLKLRASNSYADISITAK